MRSAFVVCLLLVTLSSAAQPDTAFAKQPDQKKIRRNIAIAGAGYAVTMTGLYQLWYKDGGTQKFAFFNDLREWKQVDKAGHMFSAFQLSRVSAHAMRTAGAGVDADLYGALAGFAVLLPVEIFDGFSPAYGASVSDLGANAAGSLLYLGQQKLWGGLRVRPKFSVRHTRFAALRPSLLGDDDVSRLLKDYNGQTYWLSMDVDKFVTFPRWLNLAIGYGAENMIYARDHQNAETGFNPKRQYYLALDFDLTAFRARSRVLKTLIYVADMVRIPAPGIELSDGRLVFHPLAF